MPRRDISTAVKVSLNLDRKLHERLIEFCDLEERSKTYALEHALREYLDRYELTHSADRK